eukprot:3922436-Ditylum_brightwellii.AAC.1
MAAAAAVEAAEAASAAGTPTSDAQGNTPLVSVATDLSQNKGMATPQSIHGSGRAMIWSATYKSLESIKERNRLVVPSM